MGQVSREQALTDGYSCLCMAWPAVMGSATIQEPLASIITGQVWGESLFGRAVQGEEPLEWGSNNWGNIQATPAWCKAHAADPGWGYILLGDEHPGPPPVAYVYPYRLYPIPWYAALDYLGFLKGRVDFAAISTPRDYAVALKHLEYYEASIDEYVAMITGGQRLCLAALELGLAPADPIKVTGDDYPPGAFDGAHRPGRVTVWTAPAPPANAFRPALRVTA